MSRQLINQYRADYDRLRQVSGSRREGVLSEAFKQLLSSWGRSHDLVFTAQHKIVTAKGNRIYPDGALVHLLGVPCGYWEAKDADDDLDKEIEAKFRKGYPKTNIIFSDDVTAVLYQDGHEQMRAAMDDTDALLPLLTRFFAHERQEVADFKKAVRKFALDLPDILKALREIIQTKRKESKDFARAQDEFLKHARDAINPAVTDADVQEMLIQHILTEDIFAKVFENPEFHRQNNVAAALYALEDKLFGYGEKQRLLKALQPYYAGISATAAVIDSHTEKQGFLKGLYENFYKVYNPMAADRLGVVYTPGEIVRFMIKSADWLCETHFGKNLVDSGVEILDPATGTGTFIVELLESFRGFPDKLRHKYKEELHANEVAILPYYVANLNIEATYAAITGQFAEYPNLCFVDTLDNVAALGTKKGEHFGDLLGSLSDENMARVKRQNERKISVILGNPPYNANQHDVNQNNKNRAYEHIDKRIKASYVKASAAHKTRLYDMYVRFIRWASDRLADDGIMVFITNRSFIDARMADGLRKELTKDFNEGWVIDLGGDYMKHGAAGGGNVFDIKTGVAISLWVRNKKATGKCKVHYRGAPVGSGEDKLSWLSRAHDLKDGWLTLPDRDDGAWIDIAEEGLDEKEGWGSFLPIASRKLSGTQKERNEPAIFELSSMGFVSNRDDWVISRSQKTLFQKVQYYVETYNKTVESLPARLTEPIEKYLIYDIKWTEDVRKYAEKRVLLSYDSNLIREINYRPFAKKWHYSSVDLNWSFYQQNALFPRFSDENRAITTMGDSTDKPYFLLAIDAMPDLNFVSPGSGGTITYARYRYTKSGERVDNITDWAVAQFKAHYGSDLVITKDAIFAYCYAVLHDPLYREKYALNLKREFPRIPFYLDFAQWVAWGEALLKLHIDYEKVNPAKLTRVDTPAPKRAEGTHPKPKLKSNPEAGNIVIDEDTQLTGVPLQAWQYRLGNRSAIDWVLDQHKEKTPRDPTIREKFNTYRFADYKESCIELLGKVVKVSVQTVAITEAMEALDRSEWEK